MGLPTLSGPASPVGLSQGPSRCRCQSASLPSAMTSKRKVSQYRVFVILENRRSGTRIWEGEARSPLSQSNPERVAQSMVAPLIDSLGETLRHETVELP